MAIAPIDLQVMYAQMNNVAKIAVNQQQGTVLSQQLQEQKIIQQNLEKSVAVKKTADNEAKSQLVGDGRKNSNNSSPQSKNERNNDDTDMPEKEQKQEIKEFYLGQHIDISR